MKPALLCGHTHSNDKARQPPRHQDAALVPTKTLKAGQYLSGLLIAGRLSWVGESCPRNECKPAWHKLNSFWEYLIEFAEVYAKGGV